jgi:hypothetical protein
MNYNKVDPFHPDFDWFAFLAQDVNELSLDILDEANHLADNWVTCACGQLCQALPKEFGNQPADPELADLGMQFARKINDMIHDICNETRDEAVLILNAIEARTTKLLQELQVI